MTDQGRAWGSRHARGKIYVVGGFRGEHELESTTRPPIAGTAATPFRARYIPNIAASLRLRSPFIRHLEPHLNQFARRSD
jgi:hypothetical protein